MAEPDIRAEFSMARMRAIEAYSNLEHSLRAMFALVSGTTADVSGVIFFKITATRTRSAILESLYKKKFGSRYQVFWRSCLSAIGALDQQRNEIVHWTTMSVTTGEGPGKVVDVKLMPPNFWGHDESTPALTVENFDTFAAKCDVYSRGLSVLHDVLLGPPGLPPAAHGAWSGIFSLPLEYPIPDTHPLSPKYVEPTSPPPASGA